MADDATVQAEPPEDAPPPGKGPVGTIHEEIQKAIAERNPEVRAAIVKEGADEKLEERKKMVRTALGKAKEARSALQKIKPKPIAYDENDKVISEGFDKAQVDERKKHKETIAKIEAALEDALTKGDYTKLQKVAG
jgi:ribosome recycling factor